MSSEWHHLHFSASRSTKWPDSRRVVRRASRPRRRRACAMPSERAYARGFLEREATTTGDRTAPVVGPSIIVLDRIDGRSRRQKSPNPSIGSNRCRASGIGAHFPPTNAMRSPDWITAISQTAHRSPSVTRQLHGLPRIRPSRRSEPDHVAAFQPQQLPCLGGACDLVPEFGEDGSDLAHLFGI